MQLMKNAPFAVCSGAYQDAAMLFALFVNVWFCALYCLRQPAQAQTAFCDTAIKPVAKFNGLGSAFDIDHLVLWGWFDGAGFDAIYPVLQNCIGCVGVTNQVEVTILVNDVIRVYFFVEQGLL